MTSPNFYLLALSTTSDIIDLPFIFNKGLFGNLEAESLDGININVFCIVNKLIYASKGRK